MAKNCEYAANQWALALQQAEALRERAVREKAGTPDMEGEIPFKEALGDAVMNIEGALRQFHDSTGGPPLPNEVHDLVNLKRETQSSSIPPREYYVELYANDLAHDILSYGIRELIQCECG